MPRIPDQELEAILRNLPPRSLSSVLFNTANAYAQTGHIAMAAIATSGNADFAAPAIMCKSFCVELLLKFFVAVAHPEADVQELKARGVNLYGHVYSDLFDRIDEATRRSIAASFSAVAGRQVSESGSKSACANSSGGGGQISHATSTAKYTRDEARGDQSDVVAESSAAPERTPV